MGFISRISGTSTAPTPPTASASEATKSTSWCKWTMSVIQGTAATVASTASTVASITAKALTPFRAVENLFEYLSDDEETGPVAQTVRYGDDREEEIDNDDEDIVRIHPLDGLPFAQVNSVEGADVQERQTRQTLLEAPPEESTDVQEGQTRQTLLGATPEESTDVQERIEQMSLEEPANPTRKTIPISSYLRDRINKILDFFKSLFSKGQSEVDDGFGEANSDHGPFASNRSFVSIITETDTQIN